MKRFIVSILALIMSLSVLSGCSGTKSKADSSATETKTDESTSDTSSENGELVDCKLMYVTWVGIAPWFIAKEKGFFEKNGLNVELILNEDETTYSSLFSTNEVQASGCVLDSFAVLSANGAGVLCPMALDGSVGGDGIIAAEGINSVADLKGKTVALDKSSTPYYFFNMVLNDNGLTEDDVNIVDMSSGDAGSAFVGGSVDAADVWEPWLTNASQREGGHVLVSTIDYPTSIVDGLAVSEQFFKDHPEGVKALEQSWYDAVEYYKNNTEEGNKIMANGLGVEVADFEDMVSKVKFFDVNSNKDFFDKSKDDNIYSTMEFISNFWKSKGRIPENYNYLDSIID